MCGADVGFTSLVCRIGIVFPFPGIQQITPLHRMTLMVCSWFMVTLEGRQSTSFLKRIILHCTFNIIIIFYDFFILLIWLLYCNTNVFTTRSIFDYFKSDDTKLLKFRCINKRLNNIKKWVINIWVFFHTSCTQTRAKSRKIS